MAQDAAAQKLDSARKITRLSRMMHGTLRTTRLRAFLDSRGTKYSWVAERLGLNASHFSRILDGTRPLTAENATKLAELFGVPASTFRDEGAD